MLKLATLMMHTDVIAPRAEARNRLARPGRGIWVVGAFVVAYIIAFLSLYLHFRSIPEYWNAWAGTWDNLFVIPMLPTFADLRTITNGTECWLQGIDVYVSDPCDPWARSTNYP